MLGIVRIYVFVLIGVVKDKGDLVTVIHVHKFKRSIKFNGSCVCQNRRNGLLCYQKLALGLVLEHSMLTVKARVQYRHSRMLTRESLTGGGYGRGRIEYSRRIYVNRVYDAGCIGALDGSRTIECIRQNGLIHVALFGDLFQIAIGGVYSHTVHNGRIAICNT